MHKLIMTAILAVSTVGFAASLNEAQALLDQGKFREAAEMGEDLATSDSLALAAQAVTLGASISAESSRQGMFDRAVNLANKAIAADKNNANAHFELARAQGRLAQYKGIIESLGLAGSVKNELETALRLDKNLAGAYVALGLWNAELASKGLIATLPTGANANNVAPNFEKAISLEPQNPTHRFEYANALLKLANARNKNKAKAIAVLEGAVKLDAKGFWQQRDLDAAKRLLASLK
ncbi:hypothetical protein [Deinococcus yavapaiensis]|uniref:Tetratricopeptide repeat protein n=1 Tax=Deinococcus yavapaiensis KR-236 TaxID=694435 RepID=A0A318SB29_9DEIO|nr:hypothetical protein [Deinococcus yavapaiensis]PYE56268.1 hypothetical protein DES52_10172 [Deinococcus yavapaiensis KR-236]